MSAAIVHHRPSPSIPFTASGPMPETLRLPKTPRRYVTWLCGWAKWPRTQDHQSYAGTPATVRDVRWAAAGSRVLFMTRAEALALADEHRASLQAHARKKECDTPQWWEEAEAEAPIQLPAWLASDLCRVHGAKFIKRRIIAASIYSLPGLPRAELVRWCEYAQHRETEARQIDDAALLAVRSALDAG